MSESIRVRLAKQAQGLIQKIGLWQAASATGKPDLQPGVDLMQAQLAQATRALESNSPIGLVKAVEEISEHHPDLGR